MSSPSSTQCEHSTMGWHSLSSKRPDADARFTPIGAAYYWRWLQALPAFPIRKHWSVRSHPETGKVG